MFFAVVIRFSGKVRLFEFVNDRRGVEDGIVVVFFNKGIVSEKHIECDDETSDEVECEVGHGISECFVSCERDVAVGIDRARCGFHELLCVGSEEVVVCIFADFPDSAASEREHKEEECQKVFVIEYDFVGVGEQYMYHPESDKRQDTSGEEVQQRVPPRIASVEIESVAQHHCGKSKGGNDYGEYERHIEEETFAQDNGCGEDKQHCHILQSAEHHGFECRTRLEKQIYHVGYTQHDSEYEQNDIEPFEMLMGGDHGLIMN